MRGFSYITLPKHIMGKGEWGEERGSHFPSIGSNNNNSIGVENVKIQENSEKIRGPPGVP